MNRKIRLSQAITYVVLSIAALLFLAIWPGNLIQSGFVSKSDEATMTESEPVSVENNITQMFVGEGGELKSVDLYVYNDMQGETITFRLYDASYTQLFNIFYTVKNSDKTPGFINIPVGYNLDEGIDYFYTIEGLSTDMTVGVEEYASSTSLVNGYMSYGGVENPEYSVVARYHYANPFAWWQLLIIAAVIGGITFLLCFGIQKYFEKNQEKDHSFKIQKFLQLIINPLATIGFISSILMIYPGKKLGVEPPNYIFFGTGFLILYLVVLYYINAKRPDSVNEEFHFDLKNLNWNNIAQTISGAGLLWACFEYMNGLYEIHHAYAGYKIIFWIALLIISTYSKKEIFNWINLIWAVVGSVFCYFYAKPYIGIEEQEELYQLAARAIFISVFVLIHFIRTLIQLFQKKGKIAELNLAFFIPFAGLFVLLGAFRNSTWPVFAAALMAAVFIRFLFWSDRKYFVMNLCNAVILNFVMMWFFCMWHRPYHKYIHHRYSMGFHTVTMTGTYLTLVMAAVIVKVILKYKKDKTYLSLMPELILFSFVMNYILFTLSRTAYLATFGMCFILLILLICWDREKDRVKQYIKLTAEMILTFLIMFPAIFTLTRVIPAFVDDPIIYDVEDHEIVSIRKGCGTDNHLYMDLEHFLEKFMNKVVGDEDFELRWHEDRRERLERENAENTVTMEEEESQTEDQAENNLESEVEISDQSTALSDAPVEEPADITNGRLDIFRAYIDDWNLTGHETMEASTLSSGHAHNIYLQVAHDHGVIVGLYFTIFIIAVTIVMAIRMKKNMKKDLYSVFPVAVFLGFLIAGTVEWIFHICNPYGMTVFMLMIPLCFKEEVEE